MKRLLIVLFIVMLPELCYGQPCDTTIDGYSHCNMSVLDFQGMPAPSESLYNDGRMYFDSTANKFKCSQNGGAYEDCVGGGGDVEFVTAPTNADDSCTAGNLAYSSAYWYICVATDTWKRVVIATWGYYNLLLVSGTDDLLLVNGTDKLLRAEQ